MTRPEDRIEVLAAALAYQIRNEARARELATAFDPHWSDPDPVAAAQDFGDATQTERDALVWAASIIQPLGT